MRQNNRDLIAYTPVLNAAVKIYHDKNISNLHQSTFKIFIYVSTFFQVLKITLLISLLFHKFHYPAECIDDIVAHLMS